MRFRANVYVDGIPAWEEFTWLRNELELGSVTVRAFDRTSRCAATNVEPSTGVRDLDVPALLRRTWGHADFGIYAKVVNAGVVRTGDAVTVKPSTPENRGNRSAEDP